MGGGGDKGRETKIKKAINRKRLTERGIEKKEG